MKRILIFLMFTVGICATECYAQTYKAYISTTSAVVCSSPSRLANFEIINSSNVAQTVTLYDSTSSTATWSCIVPASSSIFRNFSDTGFLQFRTSVYATSNDTYGNNKVQMFMNNEQ